MSARAFCWFVGWLHRDSRWPREREAGMSGRFVSRCLSSFRRWRLQVSALLTEPADATRLGRSQCWAMPLSRALPFPQVLMSCCTSHTHILTCIKLLFGRFFLIVGNQKKCLYCKAPSSLTKALKRCSVMRVVRLTGFS